MAYNILQSLRQARLVMAEHSLVARPRRARAWLGPMRQPHWVLDCCLWEGMRMRVEADGRHAREFPRRPGIWHLYAPETVFHEYYEWPERAANDGWVLFRLPGARYGPARSGPAPFRRRFSAFEDPDDRLGPVVRELYAVQQRGEPAREFLLHGLLQSALGELAMAARRGGRGTPEEPFRVRGPGAAAEPGLLAQVDAVVLRALANPPGLDELAERLHLSVSSLAHRFPKEAGMTVVERIRWLRVREARRLLARRGASVKRVAEQLGFSSPFYFSKVFREVSGVPPRAILERAGRATGE